MPLPLDDTVPVPLRWHFCIGDHRFAVSAPVERRLGAFCILYEEEGDQLEEITNIRCDGTELNKARDAATQFVRLSA